jgi:hypothetical protein
MKKDRKASIVAKTGVNQRPEPKQRDLTPLSFQESKQNGSIKAEKTKERESGI